MSVWIDDTTTAWLVEDFLFDTVVVESPIVGGGWQLEAAAMLCKHQPANLALMWTPGGPVTEQHRQWICDPATLPPLITRDWRLTDSDGLHWIVIGPATTTDEPLPRLETQRQG